MTRLSRKSPLPYYQQIRDLLRREVALGKLKAGNPIPDERTLAARLKVSRMTARRAIMDLTAEGLFLRIRGRGTFVRALPAAASPRSSGAALNTLAIVAPFGQADVREKLFYYRILQGVQDALGSTGASLVFRKVSWPYDEFAASLSHDKGLGGAIVLGIVDQAVLRAVARATIPLVLVDSAQPEGGPELDKVCHRGEDSVYQAVTSLLQLGHRDVGLMNFAPSTPASRERQAGYERALSSHGLPVRPEMIYPVDCGSQAAYAAARRILSSEKAPTAVFCTTDELALGVMAAVRDHGWSIPRDLSVIGYGDLGHFTSPALSSIRIPVEQMGAKAVEFWRERVGDPSLPPREMSFPTEFIARASADCPRAPIPCPSAQGLSK